MLKSIFSKILVGANILFALALIISYLSLYISPDIIWYPAFFGMAYPYLLCINIVFVFWWMIAFSFNAFISIFTILIGFGLMGRFIQVPFLRNYELEGNNQGVSFMSYNLRGLLLKDEDGNTISEDTLADIAKMNKANIICFQEIPSTKTASIQEKLSELLDERIYMKYEALDRSRTGNAIFSIYPILDGGIISIDSSYNLCQYADIKIAADTIRIYNCHLHSNKIIDSDIEFVNNIVKSDYDESQMDTIKSITDKLKHAFAIRSQQVDSIALHIKNAPYRVIVCGDFNDTPVSYTYRKLKKGLKDAFVTSGKWTSTTYQRGLVSFRIDYLFYDKEMKASSYKCEPLIISDHYPIFSTIQINPINSK